MVIVHQFWEEKGHSKQLGTFYQSAGQQQVVGGVEGSLSLNKLKCTENVCREAGLKKAQNMPEHIDWAHGTHPRAVKEAEALAEGVGSMSTLNGPWAILQVACGKVNLIKRE